MRNAVRRIGYPLLLAALYLVCSARSCDDGTTEAQRAADARDAVRDSIENMAVPGNDALRQYESLALEQFRDYAGYRAIARDPAGDTLFRRKAEEMAARLTASGAPGPDISALPDSVWIASPLVPAGDSTWSGVIGYTCGAKPGTAGFRLQRLPKAIGGDTLRVWSVVLSRL